MPRIFSQIRPVSSFSKLLTHWTDLSPSNHLLWLVISVLSADSSRHCCSSAAISNSSQIISNSDRFESLQIPAVGMVFQSWCANRGEQVIEQICTSVGAKGISAGEVFVCKSMVIKGRTHTISSESGTVSDCTAELFKVWRTSVLMTIISS